jgi:DNA-binding MarR family transcriptional regulator
LYYPAHDRPGPGSPGGVVLTLRRSRRSLPHPPAEAQRLVDLLSSLGSTTFRQLLWQKSAELDLTYAQSQVLFHVAEHPGCHMGEVGKAFGVTLPAVTHIVDRLEQKQFVVRGDDPADRRVYVLELTRQGKALVQELHTMQTKGMEAVLQRMPAEDRQRVLKGLEALVEAAAEAAKP